VNNSIFFNDQYELTGMLLPVTWAYHFDTDSPSWTVNATWMNRVETVVDEVLQRGLYAVLNVHHDSWIWADVSASGANLTMIEEKFSALWTQIAAKFKCKSSKLIFEAINEPPGSSAADGAELNKLNGLFLNAVASSGGYNPKRVVSLSGLSMDSYKTEQFFEAPVNTTQPWGLQFHYYSPYDFIFGAWGKTIWGSDADKAQVDLDFGYFRGNFSTIPVWLFSFFHWLNNMLIMRTIDFHWRV
jgi:endoglucanase